MPQILPRYAPGKRQGSLDDLTLTVEIRYGGEPYEHLALPPDRVMMVAQSECGVSSQPDRPGMNAPHGCIREIVSMRTRTDEGDLSYTRSLRTQCSARRARSGPCFRRLPIRGASAHRDLVMQNHRLCADELGTKIEYGQGRCLYTALPTVFRSEYPSTMDAGEPKVL